LGRSLEAQGIFPFSSDRKYWYLLGRGALRHGLASLGLAGEVLVPAYNHGVELAALTAAGMTPAFYPIDRQMRYDPDAVKALVTRETRAIYVTHFWGFPQSLTELSAFCKAEGLALIEDCALSLFAEADGVACGSTGDMSIFSLHKTLGVPHGGLLVLNHEPTVEPASTQAPTLRWATRGSLRRLSSRLDIALPALGRARRGRHQDEGPSDEAAHRSGHGWEDFEPEALDMGANPIVRHIALHEDGRRIVATLRRNYLRLASQLPPDRLWWEDLPGGACPLFAPVFVHDKLKAVDFLNRHGVEAVPVWLDAPAAVPAGRFPEAEHLRRHLLEVPCHQDLGAREMDYVADMLSRAFSLGM
jgi:hypothetical protein